MAKFNSFATVLLALFVSVGCSRATRSNLAAEESAIRRADADWLSAAAAHDLNRVLPFWSDDATIIAPGTPPVVGKEAIRKYVSGAFATPGFSITWNTEKVEISQSGDMAYSTGTDLITVTGPDGKPVTEKNQSVAVWKKQSDGSWRCVMDIMSPAAAPNSK